MSERDDREFAKAKERSNGHHGPGGPGAFYAGPKPDMKKTIGRLLGYVKKDYSLHIIVVVICIILSSVGQVAGTYILRYLIDDYITPFIGMEDPKLSLLLLFMGGMLLAYVITVASTYLYNRMMIYVSQGVMKNIRDDMFEHMQTLSISYFDTHAKGDLMSRYTNDADTLRQFLSQGMVQIFSALITTVTVFVSMISLSPVMTVVVVILLAAMVWIMKTLGSLGATYFQKQQKSLGAINGYIEEMIQGQKVVKVFCHEEECKEQFDSLNAELRENAGKANIIVNALGPMMGQLGNLIYLLVAVIGAVFAITGFAPITLGILASFLTFTKNLIQPVSMLSQQINSVVMAMAGADRMFKLIDEAPEIDEGGVTLVNVTEGEDGELTETDKRSRKWAWKRVDANGDAQYVRLCGDVRLEHVNFGYQPEKTVLSDMNLFAKPGQKIAFVGHTGAGKTTITNLINRFYDVNEGEILYDSIPVKEIRKDDLRRSLGIVLQDTHLFYGTIMDNIRYGRLDATDEECIAAAKLANAHSFIKHLPQGYDTIIDSDGGNISQGQCQLLAIARAAVCDPPVLILDEATSSIDTRTEKIISEGMDRLMEGRTVFVIAHRLSTVQNANAILVLDNGKVVERGDHEELIAQKGIYYSLYTGTAELA